MKICFISTFPPSKVVLNEYGFHVARELQNDPLISLTVLADELIEPEQELQEFDVERCWKMNRLSNHRQLLKCLRDIKPDVVWFNLVFSTFGNKETPLAAFSGLTLPAMTRMAGYYTHVTLHHLMDHIDLEDAGVKHKTLFKLAGNLATRMILMANSVSVLLPAYRRTLIDKYRGENIHFRAHGILGARPVYPDFAMRGNPEHRILAFGKWGTYKRCEMLIEAFEQQVAPKVANARLVIAGTNNGNSPGYIESLRDRYSSHPRIDFVGYVEEEQIPEIFGSSSFMVMPYTSATGASGVAHLAAQHGVPIICSDIPDFREMGESEGLAIKFYPIGEKNALAQQMIELLQNEQEQHEMAEQNFSAALRLTMPQIIRQYVRAFDRHQRARALEAVSRFRRIPAWVPSRSAIFRASSPRWGNWV
ncbi:MAG TPA: glycosyltransferase [Candidatus Angelobacter sp.]|jgi:glycosyltransferase involved in cell wall biosynthesis|nr:glycosyltransferase [Candidatus Angelobacter sp.]